MAAHIHPQAEDGFSSGKSEFYNIARPPYPDDLFRRLKAAAGPKQTYRIVEIGAGTGTLTRGLLSHPDWNSCIEELRAFEPSPGMRDVFAKTIDDKRVTLSDGMFDKVEVPAGWADLIVIGTAFHWCQDFDAALREFARVLSSDGIVGLAWNEVAKRRVDWVSKIVSIGLRYDTEGFLHNDKWRIMDKSPVYRQLFHPFEEQIIPHDVIGPSDVVVNRVLSWSAIAALGDTKEKEKIAREVEEVIYAGDDVEWVDRDKGILRFPHDTLLVVLRQR